MRFRPGGRPRPAAVVPTRRLARILAIGAIAIVVPGAGTVGAAEPASEVGRPLAGITAFVVGPVTGCALIDDGTVRCRGANEGGQAGAGTVTRCRARAHGARRGLTAAAPRAILPLVSDTPAAGDTRIDRWLTAVRLVKTRPLATQLCEAGHVRVNGKPAKPSAKVRAGDRVEAWIAERERIVEVVRPIESRVGAPIALTCYVDHSPPVVPDERPGFTVVRGEGRPNKRLRRELDRLRRIPGG